MIGTESFKDQLERADAGSWQIAGRGATRAARADGTSVGDFRFRLAVEPQLIPQLCASRDGRRHAGAVPRSSRTTRSWYLRCCPRPRAQYVDRRAAVQSTSWCSSRPAVQLCHATVECCEVVWHSLTALICRPQLALTPEPAGQSPSVVGLCSKL